jgi:hypothetical protein
MDMAHEQSRRVYLPSGIAPTVCTKGTVMVEVRKNGIQRQYRLALRNEEGLHGRP